MPHHTHHRAASEDELTLLREWLASAPTTASRWRQGAQNALVLCAASLLGFVVVWLCVAWLARRLVGIDYGLHSAAAPWLLGSATPLCAVFAVGSSMLWLKRWKDCRPSLAADVSRALVVEEHYAVDAVRQFQEPEHGGLIYFLRTTDGRVLTLDGVPGRDIGLRGGDTLTSNVRPMSKLVMVRAPETGWVISKTFSGEPLELPAPVELTAAPRQWPETEAYCEIPWPQLESVLGSTTKR